LSKALFIFSYNEESKVNKILKARMYVIHTKGFKDDDKLKICEDFLFPDILQTYDFKDKVVFEEEVLRYIIQNYTEKEEGVRNLRRCIETIVSKVNIYSLTHEAVSQAPETPETPETPEKPESLSFTIKEFALPLTLTKDHVDTLLNKNTDGAPPFGMYC